jgi:uncharacterized membrane protein YbjE (DUF340 family)
VAFDPFLYVAFALGWVVGRLVPHRSPWVGRATLGCVGVLLFLLGASFRSAPVDELLAVVPYAVLLAALVLVLTGAIALALRPARAPGTLRAARPAPGGLPTSVVLLAALVIGVAAGRFVALPTGELVTWALYALLALVAFGLDLSWGPLRRAWAPIVAGVAGALGAAAIVALVVPWGAPPVFASALAFGWYSLAAPIVGARAGAALGLFAFLVNFLREATTILLAPRLGPVLGSEGLTAVGGATSMDTTLYFITRYGEADAGSLAIASGLVLTAAASFLVPLALAL